MKLDQKKWLPLAFVLGMVVLPLSFSVFQSFVKDKNSHSFASEGINAFQVVEEEDSVGAPTQALSTPTVATTNGGNAIAPPPPPDAEMAAQPSNEPQQTHEANGYGEAEAVIQEEPRPAYEPPAAPLMIGFEGSCWHGNPSQFHIGDFCKQSFAFFAIDVEDQVQDENLNNKPGLAQVTLSKNECDITLQAYVSKGKIVDMTNVNTKANRSRTSFVEIRGQAGTHRHPIDSLILLSENLCESIVLDISADREIQKRFANSRHVKNADLISHFGNLNFGKFRNDYSDQGIDTSYSEPITPPPPPGKKEEPPESEEITPPPPPQ